MLTGGDGSGDRHDEACHCDRGHSHGRPDGCADAELPRKPASVEVEIHSTDDRAHHDIEAGLPESAREMLEHVVEFAGMDVSEVQTPQSAIIALPATMALPLPVTAPRTMRLPPFASNKPVLLMLL